MHVYIHKLIIVRVCFSEHTYLHHYMLSSKSKIAIAIIIEKNVKVFQFIFLY